MAWLSIARRSAQLILDILGWRKQSSSGSSLRHGAYGPPQLWRGKPQDFSAELPPSMSQRAFERYPSLLKLISGLLGGAGGMLNKPAKRRRPAPVGLTSLLGGAGGMLNKRSSLSFFLFPAGEEGKTGFLMAMSVDSLCPLKHPCWCVFPLLDG